MHMPTMHDANYLDVSFVFFTQKFKFNAKFNLGAHQLAEVVAVEVMVGDQTHAAMDQTTAAVENN